MKKLIVFVVISAICIVILITLAFLYIAFTGHKSCDYNLYRGGRLLGTAKVDRYVTEDKIVYKNKIECPYFLEYPLSNQKLSIKRRTMMPLQYTEESIGAKGATQLTSLTQTENKTSLLFVKCPSFFTLKDFETGEKTMIFSPYNVMLYMPLMDLYNFWKKGTQFFEVIIPTGEAMPVLRDKVKIQYLNDEYIPVLGRRIEAECFAIRSKAVPETIIRLSKYTHSLLSVEIKEKNTRFVITGLHRRFEKLFSKLATAIPAAGSLDISTVPPPLTEKPPEDPSLSTGSGPEQAPLKQQEVFFEMENLMLSGRLWIPEGKGPFPAVILVPEDGPMTNGEYSLFESLGRSLSSSGAAVLDFDNPGQGKSQGNFRELDDEKRIRNIKAAFSFLEKHPLIDGGKITLIGHRGGGYLAIKAAEKSPSILSCIALGMPLEQETMPQTISVPGFGRFDDKYMETIQEIMESKLTEIRNSSEDFLFFMGKKLPFKAYREYLERKPYETAVAFKKPLLMIFGKDDRGFRPRQVQNLKSLLTEKEISIKIAVFGSLGPYMGKMERAGRNWRFTPNEEVIQLIKDWVTK